MPVRFQKKCPNGAHLLVWEVEENESTLISLLPSTILTDAEYEEIKIPHKKIELLASRVAIRHLAKSLNVVFEGIKKDENGKPYLVNSHWHMSVTHSRHFMAVVMHPEKAVGIDIERPQKNSNVFFIAFSRLKKLKIWPAVWKTCAFIGRPKKPFTNSMGNAEPISSTI